MLNTWYCVFHSSMVAGVAQFSVFFRLSPSSLEVLCLKMLLLDVLTPLSDCRQESVERWNNGDFGGFVYVLDRFPQRDSGLWVFMCPINSSLPCTGPDLLSIDQSNRYICLASQRTQRMETHFCLALVNQEAHFCLALLRIAPHFA